MYSTLGVTSLVIATVLWGSSFPVIKMTVENIGALTYTWARSLIALLLLTPYVIHSYLRGRVNVEVVKSGLLTGIAYTLGLWLQGWGTMYTTASNAAFITGLHVVFVHIYAALFERRYNILLLVELILALAGLYLLTMPRGGVNIGDMLVLLSAVAWAAQVVLVSKYSEHPPLIFTYFEILPALLLAIPDLVSAYKLWLSLDVTSILGLTYLALVCTVTAFSLQVYGQRYVPPEIASLIYLLEPVFALFFSWLILNEKLTLPQIAGSGLMLCSMFLAVRGLYQYRTPAVKCE